MTVWITELRSVYTAIKEGEANWDAVMESRGVTGSADAQQDVLKRKMEMLRQQGADGKSDPPPTEGKEKPQGEQQEPPKDEKKLQFGRKPQ